jgi:hypothetical protein
VEIRALAAAAFVAWLGACSDDEPSGASTSGSGGAGGGASSTSSTTTSTLGITTCDDIGVCADGEELGCDACAVSEEGSCGGAKQACDAEPTDACNLLDKCNKDCLPDDPNTIGIDELMICRDGCNATYLAGQPLLAALRECIYCAECRLSCPLESAMCPPVM